MKTILVTGGAGYIGSHAVYELLEKGYFVIVVDSLENGFLERVDYRAKFYQGNLQNKLFLEKIFSENSIDIVMHFAAYIKVAESTENPNKYYQNNIVSTLCLLEVMQKYRVKNIVFSSTAAVYGQVENDKVVLEDDPCSPINPYGQSKLFAEKMIQDNAKYLGLQYAIFRYFNVAGAHPKGHLGQEDKEATALIPNILKSLKDEKKILSIYGNDYLTKDGTGVRDYIHVVDLVRAHILAIDFFEKSSQSEIFNLGSRNGYSVLEVIETVKKVTRKEVRYLIKKRREGDPAKVVASNKKARELLGWKIEYGLETIIKTAWDWKINNF